MIIIGYLGARERSRGASTRQTRRRVTLSRRAGLPPSPDQSRFGAALAVPASNGAAVVRPTIPGDSPLTQGSDVPIQVTDVPHLFLDDAFNLLPSQSLRGKLCEAEIEDNGILFLVDSLL